MRIVGGALRGKKLKSFKGQRIRPTSDRVKEALFNIMGDRIGEGSRVLDIFAGTGNLGIESLSRGADKACFVEKDNESLRLLRENLLHCNLGGRSEVIPLDARKAIGILDKKGITFDIIFLDPPYERGLAGEILELLGKSSLLSDAMIIVEHSPREEIKEGYGIISMSDTRRYGDTSLTFFTENSV